MVSLNRRNKLFVGLLSLVVLATLASLITGGGGRDDWRYSHTSPVVDAVPNVILYVGVAVAAAWLGFSIYLVVTGRRTGDRMNPRRKLGIWTLAAPFAIIIVGGGALLIPVAGFIFSGLITMGVLALLVIYAVRKRILLGLIPTVCVLVIIISVGAGLVFMRGTFSAGPSSLGKAMDSSMASAPEGMGFSVGGAKDVENFRANIKHNYTPVPTDLTYEGLFYDYYFETGQEEPCEELFCPSYDYAKSQDPFSGEEVEYLSVGLNSNLEESDFERKKLNLVVVLDISGSMGSPFNRYYYDRFNPGGHEDEERDSRSKMEIANQAVVDLLGHLEPGDRFGMVLFESDAHLAKPLRDVGETDMRAIERHVLEVKPRGGTNMESGYAKGTALFDGYLEADSEEYENRIIFLTDAMPNRGVRSEGGLLNMTGENARRGLHTTFIGVGVDFNTELVEAITKIRGANYYSVHSAEEFSTRMDDEYDIEKVYGSPEADEATGEIMRVNTLFPSRTREGGTRGGVILLRLERESEDASLRLEAEYEDRSGERHVNERSVDVPDVESEYFAHSGIRKAVLLTRYANLMHHWMRETHEHYEQPQAMVMAVDDETGIPVPKPVELGRWERRSVPLLVTEEYAAAFDEFSSYFEEEMVAVGDESLEQESALLRRLSAPTG